MKVLVTPRSFGKTDPRAFEILREAGCEVVVNDTGAILTADALAQRLADCDGVVLGVDPLGADVMAKAPKLRAIAKYGVGLDNIDLDECKRRGIKVSRTVGANANAVADFAFTLMMTVARRALVIDAKCRKGDWSKITTLDIFGKTLGLVGLGAIGKGVAQRAKGFGMRVLAYDVFWNDEYAAQAGIERSTVQDICREADFISIHTPLTEETRGLISRRELDMMKPTAVIINTARGGIINEADLLDALKNNRIYGAGIDAFEEEPPKDEAWYALDNVVMGSHASASTRGATEAMGRMAATNLLNDLK